MAEASTSAAAGGTTTTTPAATTDNGNGSAGTILFVHGAWSTAYHYQAFWDALEAAGYNIVAPVMPCNLCDFPPDPAVKDVECIRAEATRLADEGVEFTTVMHSYGGVPGTEAMSGLGVEARRAQGKSGGCRRLVYVAGFILAPGMSLEAVAPAESLGWVYYEDGYKKFRTLEEGYDVADMFFPDLSEEDRIPAMAALVTTPEACSFYSPTTAAFTEIPTTYICTSMDKGLPFEVQKGAIAALKAAFGVEFDVEHIPSGHYPTLTRPQELAGLVMKYA